MYLVPFVEDEHAVILKTIIPSRKATKRTSVRSPTMKNDADEKERLASVERGEWKSAGGGKRERTRFSPLRQGDASQGSSAKHPAIEQGLGGDPEAGARGGTSVPDLDLQLAAQVRSGTTQGDLIASPRAAISSNGFVPTMRCTAVDE